MRLSSIILWNEFSGLCLQEFAFNKFMSGQDAEAFLRVVMRLSEISRECSEHFLFSDWELLGKSLDCIEREMNFSEKSHPKTRFSKRLDFLIQSHEIYSRTVLPLTRINMILWNLWNFVFLIFIRSINGNPILRNWIRPGMTLKGKSH